MKKYVVIIALLLIGCLLYVYFPSYLPSEPIRIYVEYKIPIGSTYKEVIEYFSSQSRYDVRLPQDAIKTIPYVMNEESLIVDCPSFWFIVDASVQVTFFFDENEILKEIKVVKVYDEL